MARRFELLLEIKTSAGNKVTLKKDADRFDETYTLKLGVDNTYTLKFTVEPAYAMLACRIGSDHLPLRETTASKLIHRLGHDAEASSASYFCQWSTKGFPLTPHGCRHKLSLRIEMEDDHVLETSIQAKFYKRTRLLALRWGQHMHALDLSCETRQGHDDVTIRRASIF